MMHMTGRAYEEYEEKVSRLPGRGWSGEGKLILRKGSVSNLFRYQSRSASGRQVRLDEFNGVIDLDKSGPSVEVEGLATYETVVRYCLDRGFLPLVSPELKNITVGGAIAGIGIESTGFRHGFVHDGLMEADVLLPGGDVVTARPDNEHADLLLGLPNSYGTLGYIIRARMRLQPAMPYVRVYVREFDGLGMYLEAMREATEQPDVDFVEGLIFGDNRFLLSTGKMIHHAQEVDDIVRKDMYWRLAGRPGVIFLTTFDYIFRFDYDWFWNMPEGLLFDAFRRFAPRRFRGSSFYTKYVAVMSRLRGDRDTDSEPLIQDWEVPWENAEEMIRFALENVDLGNRPWEAVPVRSAGGATLYPIKPGALYFNLGSYCRVQRPAGMPPYHWTRVIDQHCFELGGIKMLYSSTFTDRQKFDDLYNGEAYRTLRAKYDPAGCASDLYEKVAHRPRSA
jgi:FAD/FMN-containing dehydrogenase